MSKIIAIIPARYNSVRLPGKPLVLLGGRPLISHVVERAKEIPAVDRIIVATDDARIAKVVKEGGNEAVMTPANLRSGSDRVGWVARDLECDIVVNLQGDEPLIDAAGVGQAIEAVEQDPQLHVSTLGYPLKEEERWKNPAVVKVLTDNSGRALFFSRLPIPYFRDSNFRPLPVLFQHIGVYIYRRDFLLEYVTWEPADLEEAEKLEQLRILDRGFAIKVIEARLPSVGVDTADDVKIVEQLIKEKGAF